MTHQPISVLVVEDERIIARDLQQTLKELGYAVSGVAASADEALEQSSRRCPDIVLMDIRIKGKLDGIATAAILKQRFALPVIFVTAHADDATLQRAKLTEPHGYLVKPINPSELRSVIETAVYRHEMEKRLRERERWFSTTMHSIADAVIAVDLAGNVTFMNAAAEALTGVRATTAMGRPVRDALKLVDADESPVERALREGRVVELREGHLVNLDDQSIRIIADSAAPVIESEEQLGAVMVFRDVTEDRQLRRKLELSDRLASLGTMAAGVAHEINNPLTIVLGNAELVARELAALRSHTIAAPKWRDDERRCAMIDRALSDIQSGAERVARIVAELSSFARPPASLIAEADVTRCMDWALRVTAHQFTHRASVVTEVGPVPRVGMDETQLGQVLVNLLINAAHAIQPGDVDHNRVTLRVQAESEDLVSIAVRDTGEGMSSDVLKHIFDPFFTTKDVGVGTGLGLAICHGIVASVGGRIEAESVPGNGSTLRVLLPVAKVQAPASTDGELHATPRHARLLVIDDEEMVLRLFKVALSEHEVLATEGAREALRLLEAGETFDLIVCDLMMPNMTGMEFYERLLVVRPELARRVVFLTGGAVGSRLRDFMQAVPNARLCKPFDLNGLRKSIGELLEREALAR